ncbi:MAG: pilus assembly protein [Haliea sp.]|nr:pilus assembly protein [Haliea sp.]|tara:strand:+ start:85970 stop:86443 length:474 start_codon:yes stop_codon:yes gene_type:complete
MKQVQKGFTLIELMIVIAIVGILAAIALPAYQDYTVRARMSEPMAKLSEAKATIAEFYATQNRPPNTLGEAGLLGLETEIGTEIIESMTLSVNNDAPIVSIYVHESVLPGETAPLAFQLSGVTRDDGSITWKCRRGAGVGGSTAPMLSKWLPTNCRS